MQKPKTETILEHVEKLKKLVVKFGKVPSYTWLNKHGYFRTYEIMRNFPHHFRRAGLVSKREFAR